MHQLSQMSYHSATDKGDNEVKPGTMHRSPGIYLTAQLRKTSASRSFDKGCVNNHHLKLNESVAYSSQGSHTGQLDFCNWLADGSTMGQSD